MDETSAQDRHANVHETELILVAPNMRAGGPHTLRPP